MQNTKCATNAWTTMSQASQSTILLFVGCRRPLSIIQSCFNCHSSLRNTPHSASGWRASAGSPGRQNTKCAASTWMTICQTIQSTFFLLLGCGRSLSIIQACFNCHSSSRNTPHGDSKWRISAAGPRRQNTK